MKKVLLRLCTVLVLVGLMVGMIIPVFADSIDNGEWGDLKWELNETTGELTISGNGEMKYAASNSGWRIHADIIKKVVIEEGVTSISEYAFSGCDNLESVQLSDSVSSIGEYAFFGCSSLTEIMIPNSVKQIGDYAFDGCSSLTSIIISGDVTYIGRYTFFGCSSLTNIKLPNTVTNIGDYAFYGCTGLTNIEFPNHIEKIGECAFYGCSSLTDITIPSSVRVIGDYAFCRCSGLTGITVEEGNTMFHSAGNCLIETKPKILIAGCQNSIIPIDGSVTSIGKSSFEDCVELESIKIPNSVTSIGDSAFYKCQKLTEIFYDGTAKEWESVSKENDWDYGITKYNVKCHVWNEGEITTPATHMDLGVKTYTCTKCGATKTEDVEKLTAHTYGDWTIVTEATEDAKGLREKECECGKKVTESIPRLKNTEDTASDADELDSNTANGLPVEDSGCGANVTVGAGLMLLLTFGTAGVCFKKKED